MSKSLPLVGIACDVIANGLHQFHGAGEKYINAVAHGANAIPMLLPAFGEGTDITDLNTLYTVEDLVRQLDGLFLTGSPSNIQPHHFKGPVHEEGTLEDPQRDSLTLQLINECMRQGVPILAVCRGFQELNVAFGGTLNAKIHEVEGYDDHREDKTKDRDGQYGPVHAVSFTEGGQLHELTGETTWQVNSLHSQGINELAESLVVEAVADDGLIEAVSLAAGHSAQDNWIMGVQWHPEWQFESNKVSTAVFQEFGRQIRRGMSARGR